MKQGAGVKVYVAYDQYPMLDETLDLCQIMGENCPIAPGTQTIKVSKVVPSFVATVSLGYYMLFVPARRVWHDMAGIELCICLFVFVCVSCYHR